jgi:glycosyltransferase involved in cell wall biosynthesis
MPADRPIRVLRVIARLNVGGPSLHVSHLTAELDRVGYETTLVAGRVGEGEGSMEYVPEELGVEPLYIPELQREIAAAPDAAAVRRLLRIIRDLRPDVLHTHTAKAGAVGRAAALLAGDARPKVVAHTFHGHVLRGYFTPLTTQLFLQVERRLAKTTDALIAVSPEVRNDLVELGVAPASRIAVIRLGLDLERRTHAGPGARERVRAELGVPESRFLIGWLGRMTEIKRADLLLEAFARLRAEGVDAGLVLAGDGPLRGELETLARKLGVGDDCVFTGYRADVAPLFAAFDAVALSSANEGTPVTLIEASAAGLPVVATDVGGVRDVVSHGQTGFLVPFGDADALASAFRTLARDPELARSFGDAATEFVGSRYSVPRLVGDVDRLYRTLLHEREPRTHQVLTGGARPLVPALAERERLPMRRPRRRLRVILVSQYFPPEVGATQSRMQSFAEHLAAAGHQVTVISEFPNHPVGVFPPGYEGRIVEDDRSNDYRILRVWVKTSPHKTQVTRMAFYLSFMGLAAAVAPRAGRADVVVATSPPLFTGVTGLAIARLNAAPFVLDVRDLWPAAAVSLDQISTGWTLRGAEALERWLYSQASAITAVTAPFCDHIDRIRAKPPATALIPNGTLGLFFDESAPPERNGRPYRVTFAGTHGIAQALDSVLDAAEQVGELAEFAFVGDGPVKPLMVAEAEERGLANVSFHPQVPLDEVQPYLHESDALLVPLAAHPTFADFVPSKMVDFMAAGRPVIVSAAGEAARILDRAGAGIAVAPEDPAALADAVRWLDANPDAAAAMGSRGRAFARRRLRSVEAERLEQLLLDVTRR